MATKHIETNLKLTKALGLKLAAETFFLNKRVTVVYVKGYQATAVYEYKGSRKDELDIRANVKLLRSFKRG